MPTLFKHMFSLGGKLAETSAPAPPRESFIASPFMPTKGHHHIPHTIKDTIAYVRNQRCNLAASTIADYAQRFIHLSSEMKKLDEAVPPITVNSGKPQTFPNVVVDLARLISEDEDGSLKLRKDFLVEGLSLSFTLRESLSTYDAEKGIDTTGATPSAAWVLRRAFRSFEDDPSILPSVVSALQAALPEHKWEITHIYQDFLRCPKLSATPSSAAAALRHS